MVFIASFLMFLFFVLALSLSYLIKGKVMKTEEEATAEIMGSCQMCSKLCTLAGKKDAKPKKDLCQLDDLEIPHQSV